MFLKFTSDRFIFDLSSNYDFNRLLGVIYCLRVFKNMLKRSFFLKKNQLFRLERKLFKNNKINKINKNFKKPVSFLFLVKLLTNIFHFCLMSLSDI
jgi:hypothetical protein